MQTELFADAVSEITVTGTTVRIDLVSLSMTMRDDAGQPAPELRQRIVMSIEGFANSFDVIEKAMNGLIEAGAIRRNEPRDVVVPGPGAQVKRPVAPQADGHRLNSSPNFA